MKRDVRVVASAQVAAGFRAAGLPTVAVDDAVQVAEVIAKLLNDPGMGTILLEERLHDALPDDLRARPARQPLPLVVPFPGPVWGAGRDAAEAYIVELLRRAIGYRVRLS